MNILILSTSACYHSLAQSFANQNHTVYHVGAHPTCVRTDNYIPISRNKKHIKNGSFDLDFIPTEDVDQLENFVKDKNFDFVMTASLPYPSTQYAHDMLQRHSVPYFFVTPKNTILEKDKFVTKQILNELGIPTGKGKLVSGQYLFDNFKSLPRPFVVKLNYIFQSGRQTTLVDNNNYDEVYSDLFSFHLKEDVKLTNITMDASVVIEDVVNIKREYSYHILVNDTGWQYFGSARDYKKSLDNDLGFNSSSMGAYNVDDIDPRVHEYAEKIVSYLKNNNWGYKGFMFLGIAVDENNVPVVLEINTRSGDPELPAILGSVTNDLGELFRACSRDESIPTVTHNNNKTVTIKLANRVYDWSKPASFLPKLETPPPDIMHSLEGFDPPHIKHSIFTASDITHSEASKKLYNYLDKQFVGQYRYRRDIGILK
jgi:phosphoribosylamine--glycine ligase